MKRHISAAFSSIVTAIMLTGLLVAVQLEKPPSPGPTVDAIQTAACGIPRRPDGGWPDPPPDPEEPDEGFERVIEVQLQCGNSRIGFPGLVGGSAITVATKSSWTPAYGKPNPELAQKLATQTIDEIAVAVKAIQVPWPSPTAKRAGDMDSYNVYSIMAFDEAVSLQYQFKFGITKVGEARPQSQIEKCHDMFGPPPRVKCRHFWLRTGIEGWLKARRIEALHAARYKDWHPDNECPPGMPRCL